MPLKPSSFGLRLDSAMASGATPPHLSHSRITSSATLLARLSFLWALGPSLRSRTALPSPCGFEPTGA